MLLDMLNSHKGWKLKHRCLRGIFDSLGRLVCVLSRFSSSSLRKSCWHSLSWHFFLYIFLSSFSDTSSDLRRTTSAASSSVPPSRTSTSACRSWTTRRKWPAQRAKVTPSSQPSDSWGIENRARTKGAQEADLVSATTWSILLKLKFSLILIAIVRELIQNLARTLEGGVCIIPHPYSSPPPLYLIPGTVTPLYDLYYDFAVIMVILIYDYIDIALQGVLLFFFA